MMLTILRVSRAKFTNTLLPYPMAGFLVHFDDRNLVMFPIAKSMFCPNFKEKIFQFNEQKKYHHIVRS